MINAMIFDLDGTLAQTEKLKALSYAKAAVELCPELAEDEVLAAARHELSGPEIASELMVFLKPCGPIPKIFTASSA